MSQLPAILGGPPIFDRPFPPYNPIGAEERDAVVKVMESGVLSGFIGEWVPEFFGGPKVRQLEEEWAGRFEVKYAVTVNSATSGLIAAIGALGIEPGDEVIVTPCTMSATAAAIVHYGGLPVFADICPHTFCIDPRQVERLVTGRTRAIVGVNIYGETAEWDALRAVAVKHGLKTLEDAAQSPGGLHNGRKSGTLADIGVFSLNRHKHIQCGEGGVCVTNDDELADRLRLIRNHGEAVVGAKGTKNVVNLVGYNFRMTELEAAIAVEQLKKLDRLVEARRALCQAIIEALAPFEGIIPPISSPLSPAKAPPGLCRPASTAVKHVYYLLAFQADTRKLGLSRKAFVKAMNAEGIPLVEGGYPPIYLQPMYQEKVAFGNKGFPFSAADRTISYEPGLCPIAETLFFGSLFYFPTQSFAPAFEEVARFRHAADRILRHRRAVEERCRTET